MLANACEQQIRLEPSRVMSPALLGLTEQINRELGKADPPHLAPDGRHPPQVGEGNGLPSPSWQGLGSGERNAH